jgi:hypothetical protein
MTELQLIIGHQRPKARFPRGFRFVTDHPAGDADLFAPVHEVYALGLTDRRIGEYAFLFALCRVLPGLCGDAAPERVTIAQYRRLVLNRAIGPVAPNVPFARVCTPQQFEAVTAEHAGSPPLWQPTAGDWLISTVARTGSAVMNHYARYHVLRDWLRFCSDAVDAGALTNTEAMEASQADSLIPAPSNGMFPATVVVEHLTRLELMALAFLKGGFVERADYQRRALGFCLERMHSYLVLQSLRQHGLQAAAVQGFHTVISADAAIQPTR